MVTMMNKIIMVTTARNRCIHGSRDNKYNHGNQVAISKVNMVTITKATKVVNATNVTLVTTVTMAKW
jgi:hypothetical protein